MHVNVSFYVVRREVPCRLRQLQRDGDLYGLIFLQINHLHLLSNDDARTFVS